MIKGTQQVTRRRFLQSSAVGVAAATIVPRNVLGQGETPPSEEFGGALIGCGGRGGGTFNGLGPGVRRLASCDVKYKDRVDNDKFYTDYPIGCLFFQIRCKIIESLAGQVAYCYAAAVFQQRVRHSIANSTGCTCYQHLAHRCSSKA